VKNRLLAAALAASALTGCISKAEYRQFVKSTRAYYDEVTPAYVAAVQSDSSLPEQSRKNRLSMTDDYLAALEAAEERAGLVEDEQETEE